MNYKIQNISMRAKSQKSSSIRRISNNFFNNLYNNFLEVGISHCIQQVLQLDSSGKYKEISSLQGV
jgi:hypothetical protein